MMTKFYIDAERHTGLTILGKIIEVILDTDDSGHNCMLDTEDEFIFI